MNNDPKTAGFQDIASEAAGRLEAATSILERIDLPADDLNGWEHTIALDAVRDVASALRQVADRPDDPSGGAR